MKFPLWSHTIFVTLAGSHAHGTAREGSDVDVRGVCVAPLPLRLSLFDSFEQHEGPLEGDLLEALRPRLLRHDTAADALDVKAEAVVFDVAKFLSLCAAANPNALEILFADPRDWLHDTPVWHRLHDARAHFLTRRVQQTFLGYAMSQLKRIETHRAWLLHPPMHKPSREEFGLPPQATTSRDVRDRVEQALAEKLRSYGIDELEMPRATRIALQERVATLWSDVAEAAPDELDERMRAVASHALGLPTDVITTLNAEKRYRAAMRQWNSHQAWKAHRNRARAALEAEHGYDTKHAMHLVRLMRMGAEALEQGVLNVRRADARELLEIRDGRWTYVQLRQHADALQSRIREAARSTSLPPDVDPDVVDALLIEALDLDPPTP